MVLRRKVSTSLSLPTKPNSPPENLEDYCAMIYGRKQWGKSTFASQYPDAITFMFEPGRYGLNIIQVPERGDSPLTWESFKEYIDLFIESDYKVANIDTIDRCYECCFHFVCGEAGVKHPNDLGMDGPGLWDRIKQEFETIFLQIKAAEKVFVVTSHQKTREIKDRDGAAFDQLQPSCKPAGWGVAQGMCDFVFHCDFLGGDRIITVRDLDNATLASCNPEIECFLDPRGNDLCRFKIPNNKSAVFDTVVRAFHNELDDYDYEPPAKPLPTKKLVKKKKVG